MCKALWHAKVRVGRQRRGSPGCGTRVNGGRCCVLLAHSRDFSCTRFPRLQSSRWPASAYRSAVMTSGSPLSTPRKERRLLPAATQRQPCPARFPPAPSRRSCPPCQQLRMLIMLAAGQSRRSHSGGESGCARREHARHLHSQALLRRRIPLIEWLHWTGTSRWRSMCWCSSGASV